VAGANIFSMSQQTGIFHFLSKRRTHNRITLIQEHYVIDKENSRSISVIDLDTDMKLGVYTWFPYHSSDRCTEMNLTTILEAWVISAQGHFTKNTDLFPQKISKNLNRYSMKAVVRECHWGFNTKYVHYNDSNGNVRTHIKGMGYDLLKVIYKQMNKTFFVLTPEGFEFGNVSANNLLIALFAKEAYIALGALGTTYNTEPFFDFTVTCCTMRVRWYVPCSVKYPRWSSIFSIFSVELWLFLIISIVIAAISTIDVHPSGKGTRH
jgi:hypothetical protein